MARTAAAELVSRNIRVNAVGPVTLLHRYFGRSGFSIPQSASFKAGVIARVPMKRLGITEEVAAAVAFLASSDSSFVTGIELNVDGGFGQL